MANIMATAKQNTVMRDCIQKVATGPEYSKDLSFDEARAAMREILKPGSDPVQAAVLLIGLRMKRETQPENRGALKAICEVIDCLTADADQVIDIADPYDGFARGLPVSPFLPALLASLGLAAFAHGVDSVGPKYGATHPKVLRAAGVAVDLSPQQALAQLNDIGWTYIDQSAFCPPLYALISLRARIVKRPLLTTLEVLTGPIKGRRSTRLITGYVHKAYPPIYLDLAKCAGFKSAAVIRGCEGGIIPSLQQRSRLFEYTAESAVSDDDIEEQMQKRELDPTALAIRQDSRAVPIPDTLTPRQAVGDKIESKIDADSLAQCAAQAGLEALQGKAGPARDSLLYAAAIVLTHIGRCDSLPEAYREAEKKVDKGEALACFQKALAS